jgi:hypothetical protein
MPLEHYYCGDEAYARFAIVIEAETRDARLRWHDWPALLAICQGDESLACGVFSIAGEHALDWMQKPAAIFDGLSATECLSSQAGLHRLKEAILRYGGMT